MLAYGVAVLSVVMLVVEGAYCEYGDEELPIQLSVLYAAAVLLLESLPYDIVAQDGSVQAPSVDDGGYDIAVDEVSGYIEVVAGLAYAVFVIEAIGASVDIEFIHCALRE